MTQRNFGDYKNNKFKPISSQNFQPYEGGRRRERLPTKKKKVFFYKDNAPSHRSIKTMAKIQEIHFYLLLHSPYSPDLIPSDFNLFTDFKKILAEERFGSNGVVIVETYAYFADTENISTRKIFKMLKNS